MDENYVYSRINVLTGGIGSGKSTVSHYLSELGARIVCADKLAHQAVAPGTEALSDIRDYFGDSVFKGESLDRKALGRVVFNDKAARITLEKIVHPRVQKSAFDQFVLLITEKLDSPILYDCPLFFETSLTARPFRSVIVVAASLENRIARLRQRDNLSENELRQRIQSQIPLKEKEKKADFVIKNDGTLQQLRGEVEKLYKLLLT